MYLTKRQRTELDQLGIKFEVVDDPRYKRKKLVLHVRDDPPECHWVIWKLTTVKGGKTKRLALHERHKGQYWKLMHKSGKKWHSQGVRGRLEECIHYAIQHDLELGLFN